MNGSPAAVPGSGLDVCRHAGGPGTFDESARRLSHEELAVARLLANEGHNVRSQAERRGVRTGDLVVCGTEAEVKSFLPLQGPPLQSRAKPATPESVANKLLRASGQGSVAVIWAKGSGLSAAGARAGFGLFSAMAARQGATGISAVRVIGDSYDLSFRAQPRVLAGSPRSPRHAGPVPASGRSPKMSA
ncbi:MAG TPA: hypothetical protein VFN61_10090 [Acidimicrobiales bacterium]|nr:hypothetical protein [Acidimicrobiales bacterium]